MLIFHVQKFVHLWWLHSACRWADRLRLENLTFQVIWGGCALEGRSTSDWNVVTEIKAPTGSDYEKYVHTSFIVKLKIKFGSCGLFWLNLGWEQCSRKEFVEFEFLGFSSWECWVVSKICLYKFFCVTQSLVKIVYWWNIVIVWVFKCWHLIFDFQTFSYGFRWGPSKGWNIRFY